MNCSALKSAVSEATVRRMVKLNVSEGKVKWPQLSVTSWKI